jgi:hypothetical protein
MEPILQTITAWAHVFIAIVMVGGATSGAHLNVGGISLLARRGVIVAFTAVLVSGIARMVTVMPGAPKGWHMWFGIKFLLALHVFAMMFLLTKTDASEAKRKRWHLSLVIGVALVVAIGAYLGQLRGA